MQLMHIRSGVIASVVALAATASLAAAQTSGGQTAADHQSNRTQQTQQNAAPLRVELGNFEDSPQQYIGKTIMVRGEVSRVVGPRLFTIDEANWIDLDAETLVFVPAPFAAMVRSDEPITVTGTVRPFIEADIEREWGWFGPQSGLHVDLHNRPIIVASNVTTTNGQNALLSLDIGMPLPEPAPRASTPAGSQATSGNDAGSDKHADTVGTAGTTSRSLGAGGPVTDAAMLAAASNTDLVGRPASLRQVKVSDVVNRGFWIDQHGQRLFVLQPDKSASSKSVSAGQTVSIDGVVLQFPKQMKRQMGDKAQHETIYVQAQRVS